jgi:hypothetical protein
MKVLTMKLAIWSIEWFVILNLFCNYAFAAGAIPRVYLVESAPVFIERHGFNADQQADLVVANSESDSISILLGSSSGIFTVSPITFPTADNPVAIAVGSFNVNSDNFIDVAVVNKLSNNVSILLGNGNGGFTGPTNFQVGSSPNDVVTQNFNSNSDGYLDLAITNTQSDNISILLGNGNGTFGMPISHITGGVSPTSIATGDFNKNGKIDFAVVNKSSDNISIMFGDGSGGIIQPVTLIPVRSTPTSVVVGDFNQDTNQDLAIGYNLEIYISILWGNGQGAFSTFFNFLIEANVEDIATGDFNNDSKIDLVGTGYGKSRVLFGDSAGGFLKLP